MKTQRVPNEQDQFSIPDDIRRRAFKDHLSCTIVRVSPQELMESMDKADKALNGDSNDDEHDALADIRETLSDWFEDSARRGKAQ